MLPVMNRLLLAFRSVTPYMLGLLALSVPLTAQPAKPVPGRVLIGKGDNPIAHEAEGTTCTYFYDQAGGVTKIFRTDQSGNRLYTGQLRVWIKGDCPDGGTVQTGFHQAPFADGGQIVKTLTPFNAIEQRLWVNCNTERVWQEFYQYMQGNKVVLKWEAESEGAALENAERGQLILPTSLFGQFTNKVCLLVQSGTPVK